MRVRNTQELGILIRDVRKSHRWSQSDLAERVGVSRNWVVSIEAGRQGAEIGLVLRALQVLNLSISVNAHAAGEHRDSSDSSPLESASTPEAARATMPGPLLTRGGRPLGASRRPRG